MIFEKLSKIQSELFVPKGQRNDFGKYNYRSCEDILKTVKPLCEKNKCVLILDSETLPQGDFNTVVATAKLYDLEDGSTVTSSASAREDAQRKGMDSSQISGSNLSYARKYALAGLFCIDNEKDSDATNTHGKDIKDEPKPQKINGTGIAKINSELERTGIEPVKILEMYSIHTFEEISIPQYKALMTYLANQPTKE